MDLIVLRNVPRRNAAEEVNESREQPNTSDSRLISMEEVRRRWAKKQAVRRAMLSYTPQPA